MLHVPLHLTVGCGERQVKQLEAQLGSSSPRSQASQGAVRTHSHAHGTPCRPLCPGRCLLIVGIVTMSQLKRHTKQAASAMRPHAPSILLMEHINISAQALP